MDSLEPLWLGLSKGKSCPGHSAMMAQTGGSGYPDLQAFSDSVNSRLCDLIPQNHFSYKQDSTPPNKTTNPQPLSEGQVRDPTLWWYRKLSKQTLNFAQTANVKILRNSYYVILTTIPQNNWWSSRISCLYKSALCHSIPVTSRQGWQKLGTCMSVPTSSTHGRHH